MLVYRYQRFSGSSRTAEQMLELVKLSVTHAACPRTKAALSHSGTDQLSELRGCETRFAKNETSGCLRLPKRCEARSAPSSLLLGAGKIRPGGGRSASSVRDRCRDLEFGSGGLAGNATGTRGGAWWSKDTHATLSASLGHPRIDPGLTLFDLAANDRSHEVGGPIHTSAWLTTCDLTSVPSVAKCLVALDASKSEDLVRQLGLLERLAAVLGADLAVTHGFVLGRADVAVRPVGGADPVLEALLLGLESLVVGESPGCHADVLDVADLVALGEARIVHGARVPEDKVTGLHVALDHLAAALLEPLDVLLAEKEEVHVLELGRGGVFVVGRVTLVGKELVEELGGAAHEHEAAVVGTVGGIVEQTLHSLHTLALRVLVAVGPRAPVEVVGGPGGRVILVKAQLEVLEPLDLLVGVVLGTLGRDDVLDDHATVLVELVAPVAVHGVLVEADQVLGLEARTESAILVALGRFEPGGGGSGCGGGGRHAGFVRRVECASCDLKVWGWRVRLLATPTIYIPHICLLWIHLTLSLSSPHSGLGVQTSGGGQRTGDGCAHGRQGLLRPRFGPHLRQSSQSSPVSCITRRARIARPSWKSRLYIVRGSRLNAMQSNTSLGSGQIPLGSNGSSLPGS
ncbi:hypothetical protein L1887_59883 [Cichorium endivia]|nr:hypothetical protein L1887_59883 [Cichorium endivia]